MSMERRIGSRAQVDFPVRAFVDGFRHACRAVDISPTGMVVQRTKSLAARGAPMQAAMQLDLGHRKIGMRVRTVWHDGPLQAVRFVVMNDVDRLEIAERMDEIARERRQRLH
jgi:hypothetical protein